MPLSYQKPPGFVWIYGLLAVLTISACLAFEQHRASRDAEDFLQQWVAAEYVSLQEGNLLESTAKLNRALVAGVRIAGVQVLDVNVPNAPLVVFGDVGKVPSSIWANLGQKAKSVYCGLLAPCVAVALPTKVSTFGIALQMAPHGAFASLILFSSGMLFLTLLGMTFITRQSRISHKLTISTISGVFESAILKSGVGSDREEIARSLEKPLDVTFRSLCAMIENNARSEAVARMTQMLAHDVRKPFSILRMGLGMLGKAKDPEGVKRILGGLVPEIEKATASVDGLIADVMEVGSTSTELIQEPASPESLIEATLGEIFRVYPKSDINVAYDLRHAHMVNVHVNKVGRVFSNIIGNAAQAMKYRGEIWFRTNEADGMVQFCLGNAGSFIPAESFSKLFEAFFTSGKKGGTGLGLAIADKVIKAHGGKIWCESSRTAEHPDGKVEFYFTLPIAAGKPNATTAVLPKHSSEIIKVIQAIAQVADQDGSVDQSEVALEAEIVDAHAKLGRAIKVLIVDDEAVYRNGLSAYLTRTESLARTFAITQASSSQEALKSSAGMGFDLVITDIDMGPTSANGFELVRSLRVVGCTPRLVCVHSNRMVPADQKTAIDAGADAFIPKPIARGQLLKLVLQALRQPTAATSDSSRTTEPKLPVIAVADDNPFILDAWIDSLKADASVVAVDSPEALLARLDEEPALLARLHGVIVDQNFDNSGQDGVGLGRELKRRRANLTVLLSSDGVYRPEELVGGIDRTIAKDPVKFERLGLM